MPLIDKQARERIRDLNDDFRKTLDPRLGRMMRKWHMRNLVEPPPSMHCELCDGGFECVNQGQG
jgi:hypothetical protein